MPTQLFGYILFAPRGPSYIVNDAMLSMISENGTIRHERFVCPDEVEYDDDDAFRTSRHGDVVH